VKPGPSLPVLQAPTTAVRNLPLETCCSSTAYMPLQLYIFRGRGTDPTIGFNDAERARP
jgi:hypothetical protein